jgi:Ca2+/Na+ antiporter
MKNNIIHILLAVILTGLLFMLTDPFMFWMPSMVAMTVLFVAVVFVGIWTGFIMKEKVRDERELMHRMYSGRVAYLLGLFVLTLALVVQGFSHHVDPWIAGTLWVMVISKLIARLYFEKYK